MVQEWCTAPRTDRTGWTYHTGLNPSPSPHPAAADVRLFLAGDGKLWAVDVATERARHFDMPVLAPRDPPHRIVHRAGKLVVWGYDTMVLDPGSELVRSVLASDSSIFIPSASQDSVWVGIPRTDVGARSATSLELRHWTHI